MRVVLIFGAFLIVSLGLCNGRLGRRINTEVELPALAPVVIAAFRAESGARIRGAPGNRTPAWTDRPGDVRDGWMAGAAPVSRAGDPESWPGARLWKGAITDIVSALKDGASAISASAGQRGRNRVGWRP